MKRVLSLALGLCVLPLAGCFDTNSGGSSGGRYDDRYDYENRRSDGSYNSGNRQPTRYYKESDLVRIGNFSANDKKEKNQLLTLRTGQRFKGILFEVDRGEVVIEHIRVTFEDDTAFEPQTSPRFRDGEQTRLIDLPGNNRDVKHVRVRYRSVSGGSSVITLFGLPSNRR